MNKSCKVKLLGLVFLAFFMLFLATMAQAADTIAINKEVAARLKAAGLLTNGDGEKCEHWNLPALVVVGCYGPERASYYREAMKVLSDPAKKVAIDLSPVNEYNSIINSGHIEVR